MTSQNGPLNRGSSIRIRFARRFLRALNRLNQQQREGSSSPSRRYHMVKFAAYSSMASVVGSRRAWSRALLWKIRNRAILHRTVLQLREARAAPRISQKNKNSKKKNVALGITQADKLRELVPGGELMDTCRLLEETAHYIKCLTSQVQVMRNIVEFYST